MNNWQGGYAESCYGLRGNSTAKEHSVLQTTHSSVVRVDNSGGMVPERSFHPRFKCSEFHCAGSPLVHFHCAVPVQIVMGAGTAVTVKWRRLRIKG